jgi:transcriptional regulator with XRE-family HTH domain
LTYFSDGDAQVDANQSLLSWKEALGLQIKNARKNARLTQDALGDAIGMSRQIIQRYEAGTDAPSVNVLGKIALELSMTKVSINGFNFAVTRPTEGSSVPATEQLRLDFNKEHTFPGATIKITPTSVSITITAIAPVASQ